MLSAIKGFYAQYQLWIMLAAAAAVLGFIGYQAVRINTLAGERDRANIALGTRTAERDAAIRTNAANREAYDLHVSQLEANSRIAAAERDRALIRGTELERTIANIRASRPEERGPVSIIVQNTVARLWPSEGDAP